MTDYAKGHVQMFAMIGLTAVAYFSVQTVFTNWPEVSAASAMVWGFGGAILAAAPVFLGVKKLRQRSTKMLCQHGWLILLLSVITAIGGLFWFRAMELAGAGPVGLIGKSQVLFAFLLGIFFLGERVTWRESPGLILAAIGIFLVSSLHGEVPLLAVFLLFGFAATHAVQSLFVKKFMPNVDGMAFAFLRGFLIFIFLAAVLIPTGKVSFVPPGALAWLAGGQICGMILARAFYFSAHNSLPLGRLNVLLLLEPILLLAGAQIFFGDTLSAQKLWGAAAILAGLGLFMREQFRANRAAKVVEGGLDSV